jgi:hypothetical protein
MPKRDDGLPRTEACLECEEPTSVDMEYVAVHEVPKVDAVVKPVDGRRKRRRNRNLATERRQKPEERTREYCGSRKRVAVAGRRMTRCAEWHGSGETSSGMIGPGIMWNEELLKDGRSRKRNKDPRLKEATAVYRRSERTSGRIFGETFRLENVKRTPGSSVAL